MKFMNEERILTKNEIHYRNDPIVAIWQSANVSAIDSVECADGHEQRVARVNGCEILAVMAGGRG